MMGVPDGRRVGPTFSIQFGMSHLLICCAARHAPSPLHAVQLAQLISRLASLSSSQPSSGAMPTGIAVSHSGRIFIQTSHAADDETMVKAVR